MQLSRRAILAGGWTFGGHVASQLLRFGSNLLMTRLLAPDAFGVMALAFTFLFALNMASDLGVQQVATSSHRGGDPDFLDVIWTLELLRGLAIFLIGLLIAASLPLAAAQGWLEAGSTYAHPDLPLALALIAFSALVTGTNSVKLITKARELMVARVVTLDIGAQLIGLAAMVIWALYAPGVLALAFGSIVAAAAKSLLSHLAVPGHTARVRWDGAVFREILTFGRWIFLSSVLGFLAVSLDKVILGAQLDAALFGVYSIALLLFMAPYEVCNRIVMAVLFPALGEVARTRAQDLARTFYRMRMPIETVAVVAGALLFALGDDIVRLLYDRRYQDAGQALQILSLALPLVGVYASGVVYMVMGKPWVMSALMAPRLAGLAIGLPLLTERYGLPGAAWAVVISHWVSLPLAYGFLWRQGLVSWRGEARWLGSLLGCFALAAALGGGLPGLR